MNKLTGYPDTPNTHQECHYYEPLHRDFDGCPGPWIEENSNRIQACNACPYADDQMKEHTHDADSPEADNQKALRNMFKTFQEGIVTVNHWVLCPDGCKYLYLHSSGWSIVTDAMIPISKFRSSERWQLISIHNGRIDAMFPGCDVKAFVAGNVTNSDCFSFDAWSLAVKVDETI